MTVHSILQSLPRYYLNDLTTHQYSSTRWFQNATIFKEKRIDYICLPYHDSWSKITNSFNFFCQSPFVAWFDSFFKGESEDECFGESYLISSGSWKFINVKIWNSRSTIFLSSEQTISKQRAVKLDPGWASVKADPTFTTE